MHAVLAPLPSTQAAHSNIYRALAFQLPWVLFPLLLLTRTVPAALLATAVRSACRPALLPPFCLHRCLPLLLAAAQRRMAVGALPLVARDNAVGSLALAAVWVRPLARLLAAIAALAALRLAAAGVGRRLGRCGGLGGALVCLQGSRAQ